MCAQSGVQTNGATRSSSAYSERADRRPVAVHDVPASGKIAALPPDNGFIESPAFRSLA